MPPGVPSSHGSASHASLVTAKARSACANRSTPAAKAALPAVVTALSFPLAFASFRAVCRAHEKASFVSSFFHAALVQRYQAPAW